MIDRRDFLKGLIFTGAALSFGTAAASVREGGAKITGIGPEESLSGLSASLNYIGTLIFDDLLPGDLTIIGGRPGDAGEMEYFIDCIVQHAAVATKKPAVFFTPCAFKEHIVGRMLSGDNYALRHNRLKYGRLRAEDWSKIVNTVNRLKDAPIFIDDTGQIAINTLCERAKGLKAEHTGLGLVAIDCLNLIQGDDEGNCRALKNLALELEVPVVALSCLYRRRYLNKPVLADLGVVEQYADMAILLHNKRIDSNGKKKVGITFAKHRRGKSFSITAC